MRRLGEIYRSHDKAAFASLGTVLAGFKLRGKLGQKLVGEPQATYGKLNGRFRICVVGVGWCWDLFSGSNNCSVECDELGMIGSFIFPSATPARGVYQMVLVLFSRFEKSQPPSIAECLTSRLIYEFEQAPQG